MPYDLVVHTGLLELAGQGGRGVGVMAEYSGGVPFGSQAAYHRRDGGRLARGIESPV
jgi:hypothetical protein